MNPDSLMMRFHDDHKQKTSLATLYTLLMETSNNITNLICLHENGRMDGVFTLLKEENNWWLTGYVKVVPHSEEDYLSK